MSSTKDPSSWEALIGFHQTCVAALPTTVSSQGGICTLFEGHSFIKTPTGVVFIPGVPPQHHPVHARAPQCRMTDLPSNWEKSNASQKGSSAVPFRASPDAVPPSLAARRLEISSAMDAISHF